MLTVRRFFLGTIPVDALSQHEALDFIADMVDSGGGTVFTPNVDHAVMAEDTPAFRLAYQATNLALVDGMPVLWACRLLGWPVPEKISGSDLLLPLAARALAGGWRVYLLGGRPGVAERSATLLRERFPGLQIVGVDAPLVDFRTSSPIAKAEVVEKIRQAKADLVLVALGSPKGEIWAADARASLPGPAFVCVGAALDFLAGAQQRAPRWFSEHGLEWLYRLALQPRRLWRRYLKRGPRFVPIVLRCWRDQRARRLSNS